MEEKINGPEETTEDGTSSSRKKDTLMFRIKRRILKTFVPISDTFLIDALSKPRHSGTNKLLKKSAKEKGTRVGRLTSMAQSKRGLLDIYSLIVQNAKNKKEIEKMLQIKERNNVATIKNEIMSPTIRGFSKLIELYLKELYLKEKVVSDEDLGRITDKGIGGKNKVHTAQSESSEEKVNPMKAPLKRLVVAAMVTKAVCIEMKENKETMTGKELLSVFEGALVPYYFPMEEDMEDRIKSVILMFEKLLHSPDNVDTRDWPTKNMISYMLENA